MNQDTREKRRAIRVNFPYTIVVCAPGDVKIFAYTEDISAGGVRITVREKLKLSSVVDLKIYVKKEPVVCKAKVIWIKERSSHYLKGIALLDIGLEFCQIEEKDRAIIKNCAETIVSKE